LNSKFDATSFSDSLTPRGMEEALNSRVNKTFGFNDYPIQGVEDVLKSRVDTTSTVDKLSTVRLKTY
jgi:hypothetical protein